MNRLAIFKGPLMRLAIRQGSLKRLPYRTFSTSLPTSWSAFQSRQWHLLAPRAGHILPHHCLCPLSTVASAPDEDDAVVPLPDRELPVRILWGSQGGTARMFAQELEDAISERDPQRDVRVLGVHEVALDDEEEVDAIYLLLLSVTGVGEPPDNVKGFYERIFQHQDTSRTLPYYAVFGLGNQAAHPNHYNVIGKAVDERLAEIGGRRILEIGLGDDGGCIEDDFDSWVSKVCDALFETRGERDPGTKDLEGTQSALNEEKSNSIEVNSIIKVENDGSLMPCPGANTENGLRRVSKKHPMLQLEPAASLKVREDLFHLQGTGAAFYQDDTVPVEVKSNHALSPDAGESGLREMAITAPQPYETGDLVMIYPRNGRSVVQAYLDLVLDDVHPHAIIQAEDGRYPHPTGITVFETLSHCVDLGAIPSPSFARILTGNPDIEYRTDIADPRRTPLDLLCKSGVTISLEDLLYGLPPMRPRHYSIASSSLCHPSKVLVTYRPVRYVSSRGSLREGVCTSYLSHPEARCLPAAVRSNPTFRLPSDPRSPVIMVAGGCGVAPVRAFLEERLSLANANEVGPGRAFLGFRDRRDEAYRSLVDAAIDAEALSRADVSYASGADCPSVTEMLRADGEAVWKHMDEQGGYTYICGGARSFGAAVEKELLEIVQRFGGHDFESASEYLRQLSAEGRLCEDLAD